MKKYISCIIVLTIVLSALNLPVSSADGSVFSEDMDNVVGLLTTLEIIEEASTLESAITRGEFMQLLVNAAGWKDFLPIYGAPLFSDVNKEHPYFSAINMAKERNLISGYSDGTFRPDGEITLAEASVCLVGLLGYQIRAQLLGGYPSGYYSVINSIRLTKNVAANYNAVINKGTAYQLIYNALHTETYKQITFSDSQSQYAVIPGETLLYDSFKISMEEGIVMGVDITNLYGENDLPPYSIYVNDRVFYTGALDPHQHLGALVRVYYTEYKGIEGFVRFLAPDTGKNNDIVLNIEDIINIANLSIAVEDSKTGKSVSYSYTASAPLIYNGTNTAVSFDMNLIKAQNGHRLNGEIRLRDNNGDKKADVVFVDSYQEIVVERTDNKTFTVYDKYDYGNSVVLDTNSHEPYVELFNNTGDKISFGSIKPGDSLMIYRSKPDAYQEYIRGYVSDRKVSGVIDRIQEENGVRGYIIEKETYIASEYHMSNTSNPIVGRKVTLLLNAKGKVTSLTYETGGYAWGLIVKAGMSGVVDFTLLIKMMNDAGKLETYSVADKVRLDGKLVKSTSMEHIGTVGGAELYGMEAYLKASATAISTPAGGTCHQVVKYGINQDGKINYIDTVLDGNGIKTAPETITTENEVFFDRVSGKYFTSVGSVGNKALIGSNPTVFLYPNATNLTDETYYRVNNKSFFVNDQQYNNLIFFSDKSDAVSISIFMQEGAGAQDIFQDVNGLYYSMVIRTTQVIGEEDVVMTKVYMMGNSSESEWMVENDLKASGETPGGLEFSPKDLLSGDLIYYQTDKTKETIISYQLRYRPSEDKAYNSPQNNQGILKGYIYQAVSDGIRYVLTDDVNQVNSLYQQGAYRVISPSTRIMVYDSTAPAMRKVRMGSYMDLMGYNYAGTDCTKVILHYYNPDSQVIREVFIYK